MKTFENTCAQGDVFFVRRNALPSNVAEQSASNGKIVVTHSETGHDHVMVLDREAEQPNVQIFTGNDPLTAWIKVNRPTALNHLRPHDTHESIMFSPGVYEIRRQQEYDPYQELARRVAD